MRVNLCVSRARSQTRPKTLLRTYPHDHRLSRLSRLGNPHDHPDQIQATPGTRKTNLGLKSGRGMDLELLLVLHLAVHTWMGYPSRRTSPAGQSRLVCASHRTKRGCIVRLATQPRARPWTRKSAPHRPAC